MRPGPAALAPLLLALLLAPAAAAPATLVQDVEALHAIQFVADPPGAGNRTWLDDLGAGGPLLVTYGQVQLLQDGAWVPGEAFLRLSGLGGTRRFLLNSCAIQPEGDGVRAKAEFSSHKRLEAGTVRKDFSEPMAAVLLLRHVDGDGGITGLSVSAMAPLASARTTSEEAQRFWHGPDPEHAWLERPGTRVEAGSHDRGHC
jgi:hypothetical protein